MQGLKKDKESRFNRTCSCCGSNNIRLVYANMKDKSYHIDGSFSLLKCRNCGLEMTHPLMNEEEAAKYYPAERYYSFKNVDKLPLTYHKISAYYHSGNSKVFNFLFYLFNSIFYTYYIDSGKRLLEIGCGDGLKLKIYRSYKMNVEGIEPYGAPLTKAEKELNIQRKFIHEVNYPENSFDYIVLKEVLEHIPDQKAVIEKCVKWIKPGGKVIITIPNTDGLWCKFFRRDWFGYDITRHPYHYNPKNVTYFLKKNGFRKVRTRNYDPPYMVAGSLKYYFNNEIWLSLFFKVFFTPVGLIVTYLKKGSLMEIEASK